MPPIESKTNIIMVRNSLDNIPDYDLPAGFHFRRYTNNDMETWLNIETIADTHSSFSEQRFLSTFNNKPELLPARMFFICDENCDNKEIATATAWYENETCGLIHWVAVLPDYQGKGLAKPLLSKTLNCMKSLGYSNAMLRTKTFRTPAINLYLKFGFRPQIKSSQDCTAWQTVLENFKKQNLNSEEIESAINKYKQ